MNRKVQATVTRVYRRGSEIHTLTEERYVLSGPEFPVERTSYRGAGVDTRGVERFSITGDRASVTREMEKYVAQLERAGYVLVRRTATGTF